jgi:hypothetical protein
MSDSTKKRTLDAFFKPPPKKPRVSEEGQASKSHKSNVEDRVSPQGSYTFKVSLN